MKSTLPVESPAETQVAVSGSLNDGFGELAESKTTSFDNPKIVLLGDAMATGHTVAGTIDGTAEIAENAYTEVLVVLTLTVDERTKGMRVDESGETPLTTEFVSTTGNDV